MYCCLLPVGGSISPARASLPKGHSATTRDMFVAIGACALNGDCPLNMPMVTMRSGYIRTGRMSP